MPKVIAIVEDDPDQLGNYADALRKKGYKVETYSTRREASEAFARSLPDLVILDIILGDEVDGGFDLCRELLAKSPGLPVIFLTDRIEETDSVAGLVMGAWDYETKPISLSFLAAKVATLFRIMETRGAAAPEESKTVTHGDLTVDEDRMQVMWKGALAPLTLTEFRILEVLVRRPGNAITYDGLMDSAMQSVVTHNTVNTHIRNIRKKFKAIDDGFSQIENVTAVGYRWTCE